MDQWTADKNKIIYRNGIEATDEDLKVLFAQVKEIKNSHVRQEECKEGHLFTINEDNPKDVLSCVNCNMPYKELRNE
jgi:hypothetical protein